ncbi:cysteine protease [Orbilia oligospora]|uniref:Cysteine protease n=1 Tax=Orbilia oligospora TaxID=2813651 RepID=A0A7C8JEU0_ORBOL|nr:cysteine protease [Orbilia oligospora]KAF3100526.1 cysteine protease [Orbilia oligospora]KAF3110969.1 cysteine protease [Orbilia oligospora]KAF3123943.1 cysteine protease [Orbilia oligospora]KAF3139100.1 cysteine protease [Orbilia oligospora]
MGDILRRAAEAESLISQAASRKDYAAALDACIKAADLYLQAWKACSNPAEKQRRREKFMQLLQKGEDFKKLKASSSSQSGSTGPQNVNVQGITAGIAGVDLSVVSSTDAEGEYVPSVQTPTSMAQKVIKKAPVSQRELSKSEQIIQLSSSKLAPHSFWPWEDKRCPKYTDFVPTPGEETFTDSTGPLALSVQQQKNFDRWYRPRELWTGTENMILEREGEDLAADLSQDIISDCSVVASLCAAFTREQNGHGSLISCIIWPQRDGVPVVSPTGKYIVKLWLNGCYRKVIIDDFLPASLGDSKHSLHVASNEHPSFILPSLLEKAYLKAMGGYDFPGSNSGTDLYCFTGWIPEHLFLKGNPADLSLDLAEPLTLWDRVYQTWKSGDVLMTLGTGVLEAWEGHGLVGEHDYAIIGLQEVISDSGRVGRWLLVKNPWKTGGNWSGPLAIDDDSDDDSDGDFDDPKSDSDEDSESDEDAYPEELAQSPSQSAVWIDLNSVFRYFDSIYLNWNPALWNHRYDWHFSWSQLSVITKPSTTDHLWNVPGCFWGNPQYKLINKSSTPSKAWILLSRHLLRKKDFDRKTLWNKSGHISLYVFATNGKRVYQSSGYLKRGPYVDSPQTLLRLEVPAKTAYTVVVSSQDLVPAESTHSFTISAFTSIPMAFEQVDEPYPHLFTVKGSWTISATGGNTESREYGRNPMFKISLSQPANLQIGLSIHAKPSEDGKSVGKAIAAENTASPLIHVALLHSDGGKRVHTLARNKFLANSGEYKRFFTMCSAQQVPRGAYTIVASTYTSDQYAPFTITVGSSVPLGQSDLTVIPNEDAGLHTTSSTCQVPAKTSSIRLYMTRLSKGKIRVAKKSSGEYLRIGVWENGRKRWVAGGWDDDVAGGDDGFVEGVARLEDVDLRPDREVGETWLVVDSMVNEGFGGGGDASGRAGAFDVTILSDNVVKFWSDWVETNT